MTKELLVLEEELMEIFKEIIKPDFSLDHLFLEKETATEKRIYAIKRIPRAFRFFWFLLKNKDYVI